MQTWSIFISPISETFFTLSGMWGIAARELEGAEIYVDNLVIDCIVVSLDLDPILLSALSGEESLRHFVGGKQRSLRRAPCPCWL